MAYLSLETPRRGQASFTHVHEIIDGLAENGWDVELFATAGGGASSGSGKLARLREQAKLQLMLAPRLGEFDALFIRSHFAAWPITRRAAALNLPVVHEVNGRPVDVTLTYPALRPFAGLLRGLYKSQYRSAAHLLAVTPGLAEWVRVFAGHARVSVVPNGANTRLFTPPGPRSEITAGHVVFIGGLVCWHGVGAMLAALDDAAWPVGVNLIVAGDGVERGRLQAASGHPRLRWLGRVDYEKVPALLRGSLGSLCLIEDPDGRSTTGVAPLKLFEALACGAPVIATDLPYQADLIRGVGAGLVVPMRDPTAIAKAVAALANDRDAARRMGERGAVYVAAHCSWAMRAQETAVILDSVAAGPG